MFADQFVIIFFMIIIGSPQVVAEGRRMKAGSDKGVALELRIVNHKSGDGPTSITPYAHRPNCAGIVAVIVERNTNEGRKLLFLGNNRPALAEHGTGKVIELVAGKVGDEQKEDFATAAKREVMEEGGYKDNQIKSVTPYDTFGRNNASSSGLTSEGTDFYKVTISGKSSNAISDAGTVEDRFWVNDDLESIVTFLSAKAGEGFNISKQALTGLFMWVAAQAKSGELKLTPDDK